MSIFHYHANEPYCCYCGEELAENGSDVDPVVNPEFPQLVFCSETCMEEDRIERYDGANLSHVPPDYND